MEVNRNPDAKTAENARSWARWCELPFTDRYMALTELDKNRLAEPIWDTAAKWIVGAIDERMACAKNEVADDKKWRGVLKETDRIAKKNKMFWHRWRKLPSELRPNAVYRYDGRRPSYDHVAIWVEDAYLETDLLVRAAMNNLGLLSEKRE